MCLSSAAAAAGRGCGVGGRGDPRCDDGSDVRDDTSRSDAEEETLLPRRCGQLGRIPNHLSLSTSSTLSAGSTGSQARLIQASNAPEHYQPPHARAAGQHKHYSTDCTDGGAGGGAEMATTKTALVSVYRRLLPADGNKRRRQIVLSSCRLVPCTAYGGAAAGERRLPRRPKLAGAYRTSVNEGKLCVFG